MSQEIFRKLRQMLMEKLDVYRELTDQEILETIDELIVNTLRESGVSLKEKWSGFYFCRTKRKTDKVAEVFYRSGKAGGCDTTDSGKMQSHCE